MSAEPATRVARGPQRLHHHAWITADQEATRRFYGDIIGLTLAATWTEKAGFGSDGDQEFCHTFFTLADGSALAFFQFADADFAARHGATAPSPFQHIALLVEEPEQAAIRERAAAAGIDTTTVDHGYCESLYLTDPNGLRLELAVDHPDLAQSDSTRRDKARDELERWLSGDHAVNNDWRPAHH